MQMANGTLPMYSAQNDGTSASSNSGKIPTPEDFRNGQILTRILKENIDPIYFAQLVPSSRNPFTELTKLTSVMKKYCAEKKRGHFIPFYLKPSIEKIVSSEETKDICRLLQLLLVCAVNCPKKEEYIKRIRRLDQEFQVELKEAVDELMITKKAFEGLLVKAFNEKNKLKNELEQMNQIHEDLKMELSLLTERKDDEILDKCRIIEDLQIQIDALVISQSKSDDTIVLENEVERLIEKVQELEEKNETMRTQLTSGGPEKNSVFKEELVEMSQQLIKANQRATEIESVVHLHQQKWQDAVIEADRLKEENERLVRRLEQLQRQEVNINDPRNASALIPSFTSKILPTTTFLRNGLNRLSYRKATS